MTPTKIFPSLDGEPYLNTEKQWGQLETASKDARLLGYRSGGLRE
jgi:hypothetical protein